MRILGTSDKAQLGDETRTSRKGIELIKAHEGLRLDAYNVKMEWGYENNPIFFFTKIKVNT